jgi:hypothetical protein
MEENIDVKVDTDRELDRAKSPSMEIKGGTSGQYHLI